MRPRNFKKILASAYSIGIMGAIVQLGDSLSKKEAIRYLQDCQRAEMTPDEKVLRLIEDKGYLEESKHLLKLYTQCKTI